MRQSQTQIAYQCARKIHTKAPPNRPPSETQVVSVELTDRLSFPVAVTSGFRSPSLIFLDRCIEPAAYITLFAHLKLIDHPPRFWFGQTNSPWLAHPFAPPPPQELYALPDPLSTVSAHLERLGIAPQASRVHPPVAPDSRCVYWRPRQLRTRTDL